MSAALLAGLTFGEKIIAAIVGWQNGKHDERTAALEIDAAFEANAHELDMKLQESQMQGFGRGGLLNDFVDGANRLVRPLITYGVIGLFTFMCFNPQQYLEVAKGAEITPAWMWALIATVIGFWFGGRALKDWGQFVVAPRVEQANSQNSQKSLVVQKQLSKTKQQRTIRED
jgi:hypothetical protein